MTRHRLLVSAGLAGALHLNSHATSQSIPTTATPSARVNTGTESVSRGKFQPTWQSLAQYECPEWFRDAKFGIWAHWGPQCQAEHGDWYAREMYLEGHGHIDWSRGADALFVTPAAAKSASDAAIVFKIALK